MNKNKNKGLANILKTAGKQASDYTPKTAVKSQSRNNESNNKSAFKIKRTSKANANIFKPKTKKTNHQYGVIRVRRPVANSLHALQMITGDKSRSQLLSQMIKYCKAGILTDDQKTKRYQRLMKDFQN